MISKSWRWVLAVALVGCFGLGWLGHFIHCPAHSETCGRVGDSLYRTAQMLVIGLDLRDTVANGLLVWMRFLLPILTATSLVAAVFVALSSRLQWLSLRVAGADTILLGCGRKATGVASCLESNRRVLAIDIDITNRHADRLNARRSRTASLIQADATQHRVVCQLPLHRASTVYILTGDDHRNALVARQVISRIRAIRAAKPPIVVVGVTDPSLALLASTDPELQGIEQCQVFWFDWYAGAARALLEKYPPIGGHTGGCSIHIGFVGSGALLHALVLHAIQQCIGSEDDVPSITIFTDDTAALDRLFLQYPALRPDAQACNAYQGVTPIARIHHIPMAPGVADPAAIMAAECRHGPLHKIYVAVESDDLCLETAAHLRQTAEALDRRYAVVCCVQGARFGHRSEYEAIVLTNGSGSTPAGVEPRYAGIGFFHAVSDQISPGECYPGSDLDTLAKLIHLVYTRMGNLDWLWQSSPLDLHKAAEEAWEPIDTLDWSNRYAADHLFVKLRLLGFVLERIPRGDARMLASRGVDVSLLADLKTAVLARSEELQRLEHRRFCVERLLSGWLWARPTADRALVRERKARWLNATLVPYDALPAEERHKNQASIEAIPGIVRAVTALPVRISRERDREFAEV
ncbi:NAD-binding protein [Candidatus Symbiobacter mobilis]|uniref:RCK N-terminal domain-containing protein n=1 Tax=Candidatus Symbiobacter mobilis CR TaxID=946483 RepID=U5N7Z7_9BURK|nr:NAD-binding protein [Candidatus Symbiobacter mobilis]AGX86378.1 hypothetical protein Cenrod_0251 [Candidatus Symbiobacter mobilis CR]